MSVERTLPLPTQAERRATYRIGDRISALVDIDGEHRRLVGDVIESGYWIFRCRWAEGHGVAVYTHSHEPEHLRRATPADEQAALSRRTRATVAADYTRMADAHPHWPVEVLLTLRQRAAQFNGDTR